MNKKIKSVGFNIECGGEVLDDSLGLNEEYVEFFEEGEEISFKKGLEELKEYVLAEGGEVEEGSGKEFWKEIESALLELKEEVGERGIWRVWGVEYDWNLGVEVLA